MFKDLETKNKMIDDEDLKTVIAKEEYIKGKKQLQKIETNRFSVQKKWLVAASFIVFVSLLSLWFMSNNLTPKELYAQNFKPYTNIIAPTTRNNNTESLKENAFKHYESKNYQKALEDFNLLLNLKKSDSTGLRLYKSISLLSINKTSEAISILSKNIDADIKWKDKYLWYLSLAYLKDNQPKEASKTLQELSKQKFNFKKKETLTLLKSLKN